MQIKPWDVLAAKDPDVFRLIEAEMHRQQEGLELIASENFASAAVIASMGNVLSNKYAEGLPGKRYYGGCEEVDKMENLAIQRVTKLFGARFANVQPHSGAQANAAVYLALLKPGDRVLGLDLSHGGHLTHGSKVNFSGLLYDSHFYTLQSGTDLIDFDDVRKKAKELKPKMIIAGASAYPRAINFEAFREIADEVGAYLFVDMAHIAGLVAADLHASPLPYAHVVTSTTHKTLRGPRGGIILWNDENFSKDINKVSSLAPRAARWNILSRQRPYASWKRCNRRSKNTSWKLSVTPSSWRNGLSKRASGSSRAAPTTISCYSTSRTPTSAASSSRTRSARSRSR